MAHNKATGFMEDYTYELTPGKEAILQSHMMEVDPVLAANKPKNRGFAIVDGGS